MDKRTTEALSRLVEIMDELREKCPWDREQTISSLRKNTIEETYELADAIDSGDMTHIREELGDLLLHIVFYSKIGSETGDFTLADVADGISNKLVYRHPHVFADVHADTSAQVKHNWEELKTREKAKNGLRKKSVLAGVPKGLPALVKAFRIGEKAAAVGFDWRLREDVWDKVREEAGELETEIRAADAAKIEAAIGTKPAGDEKTTVIFGPPQPDGFGPSAEAQKAAVLRIEEEFGDLFFALVNAARLYDIDPEQALERTNKKFIARFNHMEAAAEKLGRELGGMTPDELENLWTEAKREQ